MIVSPFGWETMTNIYIYNIKLKELKTLHSWSESYACKSIEWLNNRELICILGETYGTISIGGDVYTIDILTNEKKLIKNYDYKIQMYKIKGIKGRKVQIEGIEYIDENYIQEKNIIENIFV